MKRVKAREGDKAAGENTLDLVSFLAPAGDNGCSCKFVGAKESRPYGTKCRKEATGSPGRNDTAGESTRKGRLCN